MFKKSKSIILQLFIFVLIFGVSTFSFCTAGVFALSPDSSGFRGKVSKSFTNKFCNSIGFGLSKESALNFSIKENKKVYEKKKEMKDINKELLAEEIAISVAEQCGYPINMSGEKAIHDFKLDYLIKDKDS